MHDLKAIRENPESYDKNWARRGLSVQTPDILRLDEERRALQTQLQNLLQERNEKSKEIGQIKSQGGDAQAIMDEVAQIKESLTGLETQEAETAEKLNDILSSLPNTLDDVVPAGKSEAENVEVRKFSEPKLLNSEALDHQAIGEGLGMLDFETAAKMSGSRFVILSHQLAKLERALSNFMLDMQTEENGYTQVSPPLLVNSEALYGTGQLPKFSEDLYQTNDGKWLIPTAEVSLTNIVADEIVDEGTLPRRYTAFTPCFRSEAGSAGKDTRAG